MIEYASLLLEKSCFNTLIQLFEGLVQSSVYFNTWVQWLSAEKATSQIYIDPNGRSTLLVVLTKS